MIRLLLTTLCLLLAAQLPVRADGGVVGFVLITIPDGAAPPIEIGLWYPAEGATPRATAWAPSARTWRQAPRCGAGICR